MARVPYCVTQTHINEIKSRWRDFGFHDISQPADLPPWNIIAKDINILLHIINQSGDEYAQGYDDCMERHCEAHAMGYEQGFNDAVEKGPEARPGDFDIPPYPTFSKDK